MIRLSTKDLAAFAFATPLLDARIDHRRAGDASPVCDRSPQMRRSTNRYSPAIQRRRDRQNVTRAPTSRRRGGAADVGRPKNGDVSTPLKFSAFMWFNRL